MAELKTEDFEYELPRELIAHVPAGKREDSRLMVLKRKDQSTEHTEFKRIADYLGHDDLLVVNDTKVIRARLEGRKKGTGGAVELLLLKEIRPGRWEALVSPSRRVHPGTELEIGGKYACRIAERLDGAKRIVDFSDDVAAILEDAGKVPLPPYIKREPEALDLERYQTVYAAKEGSVAAPTAGLHFSESLLEEIEAGGIQVARLTLHVGMGTFLPVKADDPRKHVLEPEYFEVGARCCDQLNRTKRSGGRVITVGTTSVRALETAADRSLQADIKPQSGWTHKFILPPYQFKVVDALITNFHLPRSTLLMLVCAFGGRRFILDAYREAVSRRYRFFSYGDAMLIL